MPGATTARQLPYPLPTDPINAYPALATQLANQIEATCAPTVHGAHVSNELWVGHVSATTNGAGQAWIAPGGKTNGVVVSPDYVDSNAVLNVIVNGNRITVKYWVNNGWAPWANGAIDLACVAW